MSTAQPTDQDVPFDRLYLSSSQIKEAEDEIRALQDTLSDPRARVEDRGKVRLQLQKVKRDVETQAPPELTPEQRDRFSMRASELLERIRSEMPSQEEMRKNPPGAVGKHMRFEKRNRHDIIRWKNMMRALHRGDDDPDVSNLERFRPRTSTLNMDNAQIPGKTFIGTHPTEAYRDGYDRVFGAQDGNATDPADPKQVRSIKRQIKKAEAKLAKQMETSNRPVISLACECGKEFKNVIPHRVKFALAGHRRGCSVVNSKQEQSSQAV